MSEDMIKIVKNLIASGKGDSKRLREIYYTIKQGQPMVMSDYRYIQDLTSDESSDTETKQIPTNRTSKRDESIELLRIRLAEGQITIEEYRELKNALTEE